MYLFMVSISVGYCFCCCCFIAACWPFHRMKLQQNGNRIVLTAHQANKTEKFSQMREWRSKRSWRDASTTVCRDLLVKRRRELRTGVLMGYAKGGHS